jgi:hypothetical protein
MSRTVCLCVVMCCLTAGFAQQASTDTPAASNAGVPALMSFSSTLRDANGKPLSGVIGVTFLLYKDSQGGVPLWMETQNVIPDRTGHYSVMLGSTTSHGLPQDVFISGEARWLGVQVVGEQEQPRVLLVAVPYALKAGDAETIGGLPASAFALASGTKGTTGNASARASSPPTPGASSPAANPTVTGKGVANFIPLWDTNRDIIDSLIFEKSGKIGINSAVPAATLDVNGKGDVRDTLTLFPKGTDPTLAVNGTTFKIDQTGKITFAPGQAFPGAGTLTGITTSTGSGLSGGGTSGTLKLGLLTSCSSGQTLGWNGSAWACKTVSGSGTVTSVALSAPSTDFTVTGSPVTGSGTLGLNWKVTPTSAATANAMVKRDSAGSFSATDLNLGGALNVASSFSAAGNSYFGGLIGVGTHAPQALLNLNYSGAANSDTFLVGNNRTKGLQLRDTGGAVDLESLGVPLFVNYATGNSTYLFNLVGIGTSKPQVELNLDQGDSANNDALLIGNYNKGLQLRDTGTAVDLESFGVPLYVNSFTQQPTFLNPSGGSVVIGDSIGGLYTLTVSSKFSNDFAAVFFGQTVVQGDFEATGSKNFRIDHPLDPTNKYLRHAAIESSEVLNQYSGNVVLDGEGKGRVEFPDWFAAINDDFRYQLTAVGAPGPNLYIAEEMQGKSFAIAGGRPGMKVSWQVTARRNDAYMKAHPYVVEQDKPVGERGYYTDPDLYGAPKEQGIRYAQEQRSKEQQSKTTATVKVKK